MPPSNPDESGRQGPFPSHLDGPAGRIEIVVQSGATHRTETTEPGVAVVAHPHPLYGGTMDNAVVRRTADRLHERGFDVVRFNFRGVGSSDGVHDGGDGEVADLAAVVDWCGNQFEHAPILLVGYSFGAATILRSPPGPRPGADLAGALLIAPPLSFHDFSRAPMTDRFRGPDGAPGQIPVALIYGGEDGLTAQPHRAATAEWSVSAEEELPGVGHDLGAAASTEQRARFDAAVDRCIDRLVHESSTPRTSQ